GGAQERPPAARQAARGRMRSESIIGLASADRRASVAPVRSAAMAATGQGRTSVRVNVTGTGEASVETGISVLDHLVSLLATYASFDIALAVAPGNADAETGGAASALGQLPAPAHA